MSGDLQRDLGRLEGKLDSLVVLLSDHIKKDEQAWAQVNRLESRLMWASGAFAAVMFFAGNMLKKIGIL